ncbi:DUF397 domain-containing protein [Streptomyces viridifaciens]|nr:DUF397 domain-containing protein [Streptomyces viridifaciens]UKZ09054.1 DUF397 domain-containing protein [Streptomyces viridifaciens]
MKTDQSLMTWVKSSYSSEEGGQCVEVALTEAVVHVRDSKDPEGPVLRIEPADWAAFVRFASARRI